MARTKKVDKKEKKADKNVSKTSKASKKPEKTGEKEVVKKTKRKPESYGRYLYKVLKQIHENTGISQRAMIILNDFMNDIFERIANEASVLANRDKSRTLRSRDVMTAVKLVFVGELGNHFTFFFLQYSHEILSLWMCRKMRGVHFENVHK